MTLSKFDIKVLTILNSSSGHSARSLSQKLWPLEEKNSQGETRGGSLHSKRGRWQAAGGVMSKMHKRGLIHSNSEAGYIISQLGKDELKKATE